MKKWELELENKNLKKNCEILMKENKFLKALVHNKDWHYISEEGLPKEVDKYYLIATLGGFGADVLYCKLVTTKHPCFPLFYKGTVVEYAGTVEFREWYDADPEVMHFLNEKGRVYAWMPLPALPEVK